jgi:hypothetical protein
MLARVGEFGESQHGNEWDDQDETSSLYLYSSICRWSNGFDRYHAPLCQLRGISVELVVLSARYSRT